MSAKGGASDLMKRPPPKPVEPVDPQLQGGRVIPLGDVVRTTFEGGSDLVVLGDSNHYNMAVINLLESAEVSRGAAEGGATHRLIEAAEDEPITHDMEKNTNGYGLQLHKVDTMTRDEKIKSPIAFGSTLSDDEKLKFLAKRMNQDNGELARNIRSAIPEGEKGLLSYGSGHFATKDNPRSLANMNMIKIDVFADREAYDLDRQTSREANEHLKAQGNNLRFGQNVPEAVYFADKGTVYMTRDTPGWLRTRLETMGTAAPEANATPATPSPEPATPTPESAPPPAAPAAPSGP